MRDEGSVGRGRSWISASSVSASPRLEHQAVVLVTLAEGVDEILAPDLVRPEAVRRGVVFEVPGERLEDQGDRGQALLAVINQTGRPVGVEGIDGGDVHDGSEEVLAHVLTLAGVEDVVPELAAMPLRPGVSALVDGDAKLRRLADEVKEEGFRGAHGMLRISGTGGPDPLRGSETAPFGAPPFPLCGVQRVCWGIAAEW